MQWVNVVPADASLASAGAAASLKGSPGIEQARCWSLKTNRRLGLRALWALAAVAAAAARPRNTSLRVAFCGIMTRVFYQRSRESAWVDIRRSALAVRVGSPLIHAV